MKWVLVLIWGYDGSMMGAQFGPFNDKVTCETVKRDLTINYPAFSGYLRGSCALSSIDPAKLPKVEVSEANKPEAGK